MADATAGKLQVVIVTPEKAVLDEAADSATLPMFDGQLGILPGRAALIGRLGAGELHLAAGGGKTRYFVDGGFAQIGRTPDGRTLVTVLTPRAAKAEDVTAAKAEDTRAAAEKLPASNAVERESRNRAMDRARGMSRVAAKNG